jgi:hypothetical protein
MGWGEEVMQFRRASQTLLETGRVAEPYLPFALSGLDKICVYMPSLIVPVTSATMAAPDKLLP